MTQSTASDQKEQTSGTQGTRKPDDHGAAAIKRKSKNESKHGDGDDKSHNIPVSIAAMLVTLGVVYGDIGTSPMYLSLIHI